MPVSIKVEYLTDTEKKLERYQHGQPYLVHMGLIEFCQQDNWKYPSHSANMQHNFFQVYDELFAIKRRYDPMVILELGTHIGESTRAYHDYFENSKILTIERVKLHIDAFANKDKFPRIEFFNLELKTQGGWSDIPKFDFETFPYKKFDIIIDDCVALPADFNNPVYEEHIQTQTFNRFYDRLNPGGMIIIDCIQHDSYVDIIKNCFVGDKSKIKFYDLRHMINHYDNTMLVYTND